MKTSVLLVATLGTALGAAVVLASPITTETDGAAAMAPNRAEVFVVATCSERASGTVAQAQSWHDALASKRATDRALILASGNPDLATGCDLTDK